MATAGQQSEPLIVYGSYLHRMLLTASTAATLFGMYMLYSMGVRPLIATSSITTDFSQEIHSIKSGASEYSELAEKYLSDQPWTASANYQLESGNAILYFDERERGETDRTVRFTPFAMILKPSSENQDEPPITITSESAYVEFVNEVKFPDPTPGRVVGGALEGRVRLTGPNNLSLDGNNFHFSEKAMELWSDSQVNFTYEKNSGEAIGMRAELIPDEAARKQQKLSVSGIRKVILLKDVDMNLVSEGNEDSNQTPTSPPGQQAQKREPVLVNVRSDGSFTFTVTSNIATFEEEVHVQSYRQSKPEEIDQLLCDLLTLMFSQQESEQADKPQPTSDTSAGEQNSQFQGIGDNLSFKRLSADGKNVILLSAGNDLTAWMERLVYDGETKVANLASSQTVRVMQQASHMRSPAIEIIHDDDGRVTHTTCTGAGWIKNVDPDTGTLQMTARWQKKMHMYPDPHSPLVIAELEEQVLLQQPVEMKNSQTGTMALAAEFIRLWFDRQDEQKRIPKQLGSMTGQSRGVRPRKLLAETNVSMVSPDLQTESNRLEVWFEEGQSNNALTQQRVGFRTDKKSPPVVRRVFVKQRPPGQFSTAVLQETAYQPPLGDWTSQPRRARTSSPQRKALPQQKAISPDRNLRTSQQNKPDRTKKTSQKTSIKPDGPLKVHADLIRVLVLIVPGQENNKDESRVAEVWTKGNVKVTQTRQGEEDPLELKGDSLHVINRSETEQVLNVLGTRDIPALIRRGTGMRIEGQNLNLDQAGNNAWVVGAGLLEMPVTQDLEGNELPAPEMLSIWWDEKMTFDGKTAHFFGNVRTTLRDNEMNCDEMRAVMEKRYSFSEDPPESEDNVEIEHVLCTGKVNFESTQYEGTKIIEIRKGGNFASFFLNQLTGETTAEGPGEILSWSRGQGRRAALSPQATVQANRGSNPNNSEWEYTRIKFSGMMRGNINSKETTFEDRVKIVYGPVRRPGETINPDDGLPENGGWMSCQSLRVSQHTSPYSPDSHIELFAKGNTKLEGRDFQARADEVSYDESKGLYILRSHGKEEAIVWRQATVGGELSATPAKRIEFIPSRNELKASDVTGARGTE